MIQLGGAATVIMTGGATQTNLFNAIPLGRIDATAANELTQLPGRDDTISRLLCVFREWHRGGWRDQH